jgi:hypothetical protein
LSGYGEVDQIVIGGGTLHLNPISQAIGIGGGHAENGGVAVVRGITIYNGNLIFAV